MGDSLDVKLLRRALGEKRKHISVQTIYADRRWVDDLDIVNELGGHTGCVNALSWSNNGHQLASGSDDTYLNIWDYNPVNLAKPFTLNTSISTGHHANIFSVKFMPHSNNRKVVTCAGDSQVRVFDLEYGDNPSSSTADTFHSSTRSRRFNKFFSNATWLNESNTNARVYRSHADRAKRVVTESSPHLFLTCSEDGEVRQWDLRQPSSAYPAPKSGRRWGRYTSAGDEEDSGNVPPPLISYKKYALDLNSISCSGSQPQYIALGGAHMHCFLHDRRMLGRDLPSERGQPSGASTPIAGSDHDESMHQATRCVRRFAPNGKRHMRTHDHGHITACKISDANPNELIASWSGDHIYSFDIVKSPDARDAEAREEEHAMKRLRNQRERKRKRENGNTSNASLADVGNPSQRLRRVADNVQEIGQTALRVQYENDELEQIPVNVEAESAPVPRDALLQEARRASERVAHALVKLRKTIFDFAVTNTDATSIENSSELTNHTVAFTNVLGQCSSLLPQMDEIIRGWSYPVNPSSDDVALQNTLRRNRQASWRFVQASGCLARTLDGKLQTIGGTSDVRLLMFAKIKPAAREERNIDDSSRFCYDFLKAVVSWLAGGRDHLIRSFQRPPDQGPKTQRFPLPENETHDALIEKLQTYLHELACEDIPIINLDANRFETDDTRIVFASQKLAVLAFMRAVKSTQLAQNGESGPAEMEQARTSGSDKAEMRLVMNQGAAARFWGVKVGRSLLMKAAEGVNFDFVNRAFGGLRNHIGNDYADMERPKEEVDDDEVETIVSSGSLLNADATVELQLDEVIDVIRDPGSTSSQNMSTGRTIDSSPVDTDDATPFTTTVEEIGEEGEEDDYAFNIAYDVATQIEDDDDDNDISESEHSDSEDSDENAPAHPLFRRRVAFGRSKARASVNSHVPYSTHTRRYKGHCNARTVKDVNFYGLNDEYVVSGSDDGNFFIWDRKTTEVVNILEGDGEVVNVVQGHPYEPMLAVSGIDSTVKIFGVGARERDRAARGVDVANPGGGVHSSLRWGGRARRARIGHDDDEGEHGIESQASEGEEGNIERALRSRRAMARNYEIMNQNDASRKEEDRDAFLTQEDVLARVAAVLQQRRMMGAAGGGVDAAAMALLGEGNEVELNENCSVM